MKLYNALKNFSGEDVVILGSGGLEADQSFVCFVNKSVKVPRGEAGLRFMREFIRKNGVKNTHEASHIKKSNRILSDGKFGWPPFTSGFVGFISYDLGAQWNGIFAQKFAHAMENRASKICPDAYFVYVDKVVASKTVAPKLNSPEVCAFRDETILCGQALTKKEYFKKISAIKKYLYSGDTYQVNFSHKFEAPFCGRASVLYEKLAALNPSPHQFFLETPDFAVISNSPERLFRITFQRGEKIIETRPIKGTVPRGRTPQEDKKNVSKLLSSEKEAAELAMIVDLERNDMGKICRPGTIEVDENRVIEKYSHVIHTVSNIRGVLEPQYDWYDALRALFPGGSVTGCPKKRTMGIINQLEKEPRGVYCGSAGYIGMDGQCDFNIMIRTLWYDKSKSKIIFRSGGGIVVDSDPKREYEETLHKSQALLSSIS